MNLQDILNLILGLFTKTDTPVPVTPVATQSAQLLEVTRSDRATSGIFGVVALTWDNWSGVSLENTDKYIPAGTYKLVWHISPHLNNARVPMLIDVPGRTEILLHWGNFESCSDGCILIGLTRETTSIDTTQEACKELFAKIDAIGIENVQIVVR